MKKLILIFITFLSINQARSQDAFLINLLTQITTHFNELQLAQEVVQTNISTEKLEFITKEMNQMVKYVEYAENVLDLQNLIEIQYSAYEQYAGSLEDITKCRVPLQQDEVDYLFKLLNTAMFGKEEENKDIFEEIYEDIEDIFKIFKKGEKKESILDMIEYSDKTKADIYKHQRQVISCRRYIKSIIYEKEKKAGIYDMQRIINKVDNKFKKYNIY